jgi:large subunit ribosomal protein L4
MNKVKKDQVQSTGAPQVLKIDELGLPEGVIYAPHAISDYVRTLFQNWRQGTVWSRGRADVNFSNKKPWKQKGTGRARAGSPKSPLWKGGGVIFGPQERSRVLKTNRKSRQLALMSLLSDYINRGAVGVVDWNPAQDKPQTAHAYAMLKSNGLADKKIVLFVSPGDMLTYASFINIPSVSLLYFDQPNAGDLMKATHWVVLKKDQDLFKEMVAQWL